MAKVFFTSDLHFGHKNLVEGLRNMDIETNDNLIVENWNKTVSKRDVVYILGDVVMEKPQHLDILKKLKGTIYVVGGNHDNKKVCKKLQELGITVLGCLQYKGFICTHIPIHPSQLELFRGNIHGHIHVSGNIEGFGFYRIQLLEGRYFNVNTELHHYKPVLFDDIVKHFAEKELEDSGFGR